MTGPHAGFIIASYAIGFAVIAGLVLWTWADWRATSRALKALEARSPRRRPAP
ncbi:heme exporter protein CcmD [Methylopila sp. M107]|uniref:heme exporter protein CcmD n=1 Tax=Methylopila sp. M107 TaxID=1101190 RepID=UPI00035CC0FC|nr:heme exporter protein CcmD [Methylopila sp. M107]